MERISDRLALWVLRSIAVALLFFGASMLMAGAPAIGILTESVVVRSIAWIFFQIVIGFIIAGTAAVYLSRLHGPLLPNERLATSDTSRAPLGGWVMAFAVTLVVLPLWLVFRLQPLFDGWAVVIDYLSTWDWSGANAAGSGLVLLPVAAALTPPTFQLFAALFLIATSVMLFVLLLLRSPRFLASTSYAWYCPRRWCLLAFAAPGPRFWPAMPWNRSSATRAPTRKRPPS